MTKEEKRELMQMLISLGLLHETFTGKLTINVAEGHIDHIEIAQRIK